eukprot:5070514-Pyramimonas_sp.AAC.1
MRHLFLSTPRAALRGSCGSSLGLSWVPAGDSPAGPLGPSWAVLGPSWGPRGRPGCLLGPPAFQGPSLGRPDRFMEALFGQLGASFSPSWVVLGPSWWHSAGAPS